MYLSEISTDKFADVMCEIAPAVSALSEDKALIDALNAVFGASKQNSNIVTVGVIARTLIPALFKDHRKEAYEIIAALSGKTVKAVAAQNIRATAADIKALLDIDFVDFFTAAGATGERS